MRGRASLGTIVLFRVHGETGRGVAQAPDTKSLMKFPGDHRADPPDPLILGAGCGPTPRTIDALPDAAADTRSPFTTAIRPRSIPAHVRTPRFPRSRGDRSASRRAAMRHRFFRAAPSPAPGSRARPSATTAAVIAASSSSDGSGQMRRIGRAFLLSAPASGPGVLPLTAGCFRACGLAHRPAWS